MLSYEERRVLVLFIFEAPPALVRAELTKLSLARNKLGEAGTKSICDALKDNKTLKELDLSGGTLEGSNIGGTAGAKHVAELLVTAELTKIL